MEDGYNEISEKSFCPGALPRYYFVDLHRTVGRIPVAQGENKEKKTVLLTGGAGYIGSHTAVELIGAGYNVVIADDLSNSEKSVLDRVGQIAGTVPEFHEVDVSDGEALDRLFRSAEEKGSPIDAVIHFAGFKAVGESCAKPVKYYRNNIDMTLTLLEVMKAHGCRSIIFSSSATVYGAEGESPLKETVRTGGCTNPYGMTKYFNEIILRDTAAAEPELSVVLLRYFNPIGAHPSGLIGERPNGIPNNLMPYVTQVAAGILKQLSVFGNDYDTRDGTGVRDYIHVVDLAKGHLKALEYSFSHSGCEVFNLGTGVGYSVLDIVKTFEKVNGVKIPYVIAPRRAGDIAEYYGDPTKAYELLGWKTEKTLDDMCRDSWNWQKYAKTLSDK